jgi:hypothetical protein
MVSVGLTASLVLSSTGIQGRLQMVRRVAGAGMLILAASLACWIIYNLFIETLPDAKARSPLGAILLAYALFYVGIAWIRGKTAR